jgi:hypothetical protein
MTESEKLEKKIDDIVDRYDSIETDLVDIAIESTKIDSPLYGGASDSEPDLSKNIEVGKIDMADIRDIRHRYIVATNEAIPLIREYIPDEIDRFKDAQSAVELLIEFEEEVGKKISHMSVSVYSQHLGRALDIQKNALLSILPRLDAEKLKIRKDISRELITKELAKAKDMFEEGHIRCAGILAGVALERHLITVCESSEKDIEYTYSDNITQYADELYNKGEITKSRKKQIVSLAGVRNDCGHAEQDEPKRNDVRRLVDQTEEIIKNA